MTTPYITLYLCRHGETAFNASKVLQGRSIDLPLNEEGIRQSQLLAKRFHGLNLNKIASSSMKRAKQTAVEIVKLHPEAIYESHEDLAEISWGKFEGQHNPDLSGVATAWANGDFNAKPDGGESPRECEQRVIPVILNLLDNVPKSSGHVVVVAHSRVLRFILSRLLDGTLATMNKYGHKNTCVNELRAYRLEETGENELGYRFEMVMLKDISHLEGHTEG